MPKINVYLPDELAQAVKEAGIPVSTVCQRALEQAVRRVTAVHESLRADDFGTAFDSVGKFTGRVRVLVAMAVEAAQAQDRPVGTDHLLAALIEEGDGLGLKVLSALEIEPEQLTAALASRHDRGTGSGFTATAQEALRLAATESTALGHSIVGTEHVLLGLIAEPDGAGGQALRSAGAELRLTRRAIKAALAGWHANTGAALPTELTTALTDAVREQLEPIVARLDRLEQLIP